MCTKPQRIECIHEQTQLKLVRLSYRHPLLDIQIVFRVVNVWHARYFELCNLALEPRGKERD